MSKKYYLQKKFFYYYSIVIIAIVSVSFIAFYMYIYNTSEKNAINTLTNMTHMSCSQLDTLVGDMDNIALQIIANPTIIETMSNAKRTSSGSNYFNNKLGTRRKIIGTLTSINGPNIFSSRISIYNHLGHYVNTSIYPDFYPYILDQLHGDTFDDWYNSILSLGGNRMVSPPQSDKWSDNNDRILFSLVREIRDINFSYGIVEIQMPYKKIIEICSVNNISDNLNTYILTKDGQPVYPYTQHVTTENKELYKYYSKLTHHQKRGLLKTTNPITHKREIITFEHSDVSEWILLYVQPYNDFFAPIEFIGIILIVVAISLITTSLILIFHMTNHMTKPLKDLCQSINEVSLKNLSVDMGNTHYNNELERLNESFLHMFKRLESSMDEVVDLRTSELKAHVLALQSQMNPHFLYNTLSVINASAIEDDSTKICNICSKLSNMLRYTSNFSTTLVSIDDEIKNANDYLDLMKERFEDGLTYTINNHNTISDIRIPKLILQPIIENCFSHGFKNKRPPWVIQIDITVSHNNWIITIYDNGTGFNKNKLEHIMTKLDEFYVSPSHNMNNLHIGGLALLNTLIRLKFTYKEYMIFDVISHEDYGTSIKIGGPIHD